MVDPSHNTGNGGFAGAGIAGKDHVEGQILRGKAVFGAELMDLHQVDEVFHLLLHGGKADIGIQLRHQGLDLFGRGDFFALRLGSGRTGGIGFGRGGPFRRGGRGVFSGGAPGLAPEVGIHPLQVMLRHGADDLQLLEDDLVFIFGHGPHPFIGTFRWIQRTVS